MVLGFRPGQLINWMLVELYSKKKKKKTLLSIILKPQQWKEPVNMLFPKWCSKSKFVVLISMWFRLVQFLLDQDYNQGSQATRRRKQEAVSRNTNFLRSSVTPALCPQDSTSFRKIFFFFFLLLFWNSFPQNLIREKNYWKATFFSQCCP